MGARLLRPGLWRVLAIISLLLALALFAGLSLYGGRAQTVQLIRPAPAAAAALFADEGAASGLGTPLGPPRQLIISDARAFLPQRGEAGLRYVSEAKLQELGLYPVQLKTVNFLRNVGTSALLLLALLLGAGSLWLERRRVKRALS